MKEHPQWGPLSRKQPYDELEIGAKIAEGGQADIFEAFGTRKYGAEESGVESGILEWSLRIQAFAPRNYDAEIEKESLVLKVFKKGFSLDDLQRLWSPGMAPLIRLHSDWHSSRGYLCRALGVHLMENGRFAFILSRYWGDLRKLIDEKMLERNGCPPFPELCTTYHLIVTIAEGMRMLHEQDILHNELKVANVLVHKPNAWNILDAIQTIVVVADFESSEGIQGTGFWRAPEVLLVVKNWNVRSCWW